MRLYPEHILACFGGLSLENDFIGLYYSRRTIAEITLNDLLSRWATVFSELQRVLMLYFPSFSFCITKLFSFSDIELLEDSGIPTEAFLESCYAVVPVLGKITTFVLNSLVCRIFPTAVIL